VITRTGVEGGAVYALSRALREAVDADGPTTVAVDLRPDQTLDEVEHRLGRRRSGDSTANWLRRAGFRPIDVGLLREAMLLPTDPGELPTDPGELPTDARELPTDPTVLARLVKAVPVRLLGTQPIDRAISTAGGVALDEVDDAFMLRRRPGTFVAGEMLDWEAPTGGYLLQASFSTGVAAAHGVLAWLAAEAGVAPS
jgi:predicted flavoprotein YhiN